MNLGLNLENIRAIVNEAPENWESLLMYELSKSPTTITCLLMILDAERSTNKELIQDLNLLLSKAHTGLEMPKLNKDGFMQKEIKQFYKSGRINHCFANMD